MQAGDVTRGRVIAAVEGGALGGEPALDLLVVEGAGGEARPACLSATTAAQEVYIRVGVGLEPRAEGLEAANTDCVPIAGELVYSTRHGYVDFALSYLREYLREHAAADV